MPRKVLDDEERHDRLFAMAMNPVRDLSPLSHELMSPEAHCQVHRGITFLSILMIGSYPPFAGSKWDIFLVIGVCIGRTFYVSVYDIAGNRYVVFEQQGDEFLEVLPLLLIVFQAIIVIRSHCIQMNQEFIINIKVASFVLSHFESPSLVVLIFQHALLHFLVHCKLIADHSPVRYRPAIPLLVQFFDPKVEGLSNCILTRKRPLLCDLTKT